MYKPTFPQSPALVSAIAALGVEGYVTLLLTHPECGEKYRSLSPRFQEAFDQNIRECLLPCFEGKLDLHAVYRNLARRSVPFGTVWAPHNSDLSQKAVERVFDMVSRMAVALTTAGDAAALQVSAGAVDWTSITAGALSVLRADPAWETYYLIGAIYRRRPFNGAVARLILASIERIALWESKRDIEWVFKQDRDSLAHIVDWLESSWREDAPWIKNVDAKGRPKKLMKLGSLSAMHDEADKQMGMKLAQERKQILMTGDEEKFSDDGGAFHLVRLATPRALDIEGKAMRHCVGQGVYDERLSEDGYFLLSLRDRRGMPHMTIEIEDGEIVQAYGRSNSAPKPEYREASERLLKGVLKTPGIVIQVRLAQRPDGWHAGPA